MIPYLKQFINGCILSKSPCNNFTTDFALLCINCTFSVNVPYTYVLKRITNTARYTLILGAVKTLAYISKSNIFNTYN